MQYHNINEFENMMINLLENGQKEVWFSIELINNPFERCRKRKLFSECMQKISGYRIEGEK